jgi:tetratricopeptide (TPR) repeat protein
MIKLCRLFFYLLLIVPAVFAQGSHPLKNEIEVYCKKYDINNRLDSVLAGISAESMAMNKLGYLYYEKQEWDRALEAFGKAIDMDQNNSFAHYNYACVLALKHEGSASLETVSSKITDHLKAAAELDAYWALWLFVDPDLDGVRKTGFSSQYETSDQWLAESTLYGYYVFEVEGVVTVILDGVGDGPYGSGRRPGRDGYHQVEEKGYYCIIGEVLITVYPGNEKRWNKKKGEEPFQFDPIGEKYSAYKIFPYPY